MWSPPAENRLRRLFAGITEHAFLTTLGVADPPLIDYISGLLARFVHSDTLCRLRDGDGKPLLEIVDMVREAEQLPADGRTRREYHRHIGDFTLFWTGLYPDSVRRARTGWSRDCFISYCVQGKRSYLIASTFDSGDCKEEAPVLRRMSDEFELCALGLNHVRKEIDALQGNR
jgi:hypothetical protein